MLERLANANIAKVRVLKVDAGANRNWAQKLNIRGVPTTQFYRGGIKLHEFGGSYPEAQIQKKFDQYTATAGKPATPAKPAIRPMPKNWLPPGIKRSKTGDDPLKQKPVIQKGKQ